MLSMFSGVVNPCTGKLEWVPRDADVTSEAADISHELARSQYGDMLLDKQRNRMYQKGLELAVREMKASGREPHVLDIGTGTGLLSMMAAKAGATRVTACEVLRPMVRIARQVIAQNGYSDVIHICPKRSTEMTEKDMPSKANILVTEVFDTELIGEGALLTFAHAHNHLMEPDSIVIPSSSKMYVRLIDSEFLWRSHKIVPERLPGNVKLPPGWLECAGPPSVWDLHVEEVRVPDQMKPLSNSTEVAHFQFSDPKMNPDLLHPPVTIPVAASGTCHGVVVWWDIKLGDHTLSMDPWDYGQWRDHWLQAVQLWPKPVHLEKGEKVEVGLRHDDYSIWFTLETPSADSVVTSVDRPLCACGVHTACSRSRICLYNDMDRTSLYMKALSKVLVGKMRIVCVGDGCLWPLLLLLQQSKMDTPPRHFYYLSNCSHSTNVTKQLLASNALSSSVTFLEKPHTELSSANFAGRHIDAIIGEPYFTSSLLPWHNLHFWYAVSSLQEFLTPGAREGCVLPGKGSLMAIAVNFSNLYQLRAPVGNVEGFNITAFDDAVGKHSTTPEGIEAEPHPLWEYPSYPRSAVHTLMTFDFSAPILRNSSLKVGGDIPLNQRDGPCHAVVMWMDYELADTVSTSTGLRCAPGSKSEALEWDPGYKQAVYFLCPKDTSRSLLKLEYSLEFISTTGNLEMSFSGIY